MRASRPVAPAGSGPDRFAPAASVSDGGRSAMRALAAAAEVGGPRIARAPKPAPAMDPAVVARIDLSRLIAAPPLDRPTVCGGGAGRGGDHVGGAMLPPAPNTVALSDGTRISFRAVEEIPLLEYA